VAAIVLSGVAVVAFAPEPPDRPVSGGTTPNPGSPVLVWTPGGLPPGLGDVARKVDGTVRVAEVQGDFVWLDAWGLPGGEQATPPAGMKIPLDVAAFDVGDFPPFVPGPEADVVGELDADGILLSKTGAALRGIGPGGWLRFGEKTMTVRAVVEDAALGGYEAAVTKETGAAIGAAQPRYLLVQLEPGQGTGDLEAALRASLPAGTPLRVGVARPSATLRAGEVTLTPAALKLLFGEFAATEGRRGALVLDPAWIDRNIEEQTLPVVGVTKCHRTVFPQLQAAMREIVDKGLSDLLRPGDFGGCWFPRFLNWDPQAGISHHTWGLAVDFNVADNLYGTPGRMDPRVVEVFERWGFEWGGRWLVPDPMHFEFVRFVAPHG
jgi:hypothetical protein